MQAASELIVRLIQSGYLPAVLRHDADHNGGDYAIVAGFDEH
jgi:hypothetical protein